MQPTITEVQIVPIKPNSGLIAFASVVINGQLYLGSIGIHAKIDGSGYRLTYPTKSVGGRNLYVYHPINRETSDAIEEAIFARLKDVIEGRNDRHDRTHATER